MPIAGDARNEYPPMITPRLELSFGTPDDAEVLFPFVHGKEGRLVTDTAGRCRRHDELLQSSRNGHVR